MDDAILLAQRNQIRSDLGRFDAMSSKSSAILVRLLDLEKEGHLVWLYCMECSREREVLPASLAQPMTTPLLALKKRAGRLTRYKSAKIKTRKFHTTDVADAHLNAVQSSRRLEREARCNVEVMWLLGRLMRRHLAISIINLL